MHPIVVKGRKWPEKGVIMQNIENRRLSTAEKSATSARFPLLAFFKQWYIIFLHMQRAKPPLKTGEREL